MAYIPGDHWVMCDRCGFKRRRSECKETWDHYLVCADTCWEPKHPSLIPHKIPVDRQRVPDAKPEKETFIEVNYVI